MLVEIKASVWDCGSSKTSGPDGFTFKFYKKHWNTIEHDIVLFVKDFEVSDSIPRGCNSSFIILVPKGDDPLVVEDFHPISLIGSQYKIIAKILANRLSRVVSSVVGDVQMTYIKGRQIIDGPLMVDEIIAWAKKYKKRIMFLKVDFEKAFNSLSLPIGAKMSRCHNWNPLVDRFHKRLSKWKSKTLSIGGRLTLIKSVLGSVGVYYFSTFKAPIKVINKLEGIRRNFFWGGSLDDKRIP
ncbi:RNA-directed DNA polymerase, eukaryota, reverse transcriptase zinc-binding domain protein [Tanacetum coccineum]